MTEELLTAIALFFKKGIGGATCKNLLARHGSFLNGVKEERIELEEELKSAEKVLKTCEKEGITPIPLSQNNYPGLLREISQPPIVLYVKGSLDFPKTTLSIIGSRKCSSYGKRTAFRLGKFLSENGITVVSGLALGIDTFAHKGTVEGNGKGIAVLGSSVDLIYPISNKPLAEKILEKGGTIVSEFPPTTKPSKENFPKRNRIISGLSLGTIVVEAGEKSGTFITVNYALEQGRIVFSVPGPIDSPFSRGTNRLIKEGAVPLVDFEVIFEEIPYLKSLLKKQNEKIPEKYKAVTELLSQSPKNLDQICKHLKLSVKEASTLLLEMELKNLVKRDGSTYFLI